MHTLKGLTGTRGQALGAAVLLKNINQEIPLLSIQETDTAKEEEKLQHARADYRVELQALYEKTKIEVGEEGALIFLAYLEMVNDDFFFETAIKKMKQELVNIEYILEEEKNQTSKMFSEMDDSYMKERGNDIENVCNELIDKMLGRSPKKVDCSDIHEPFILIAEDLTPADTIRLDKTWLQGFITEKGGQTSHTVILAKTLGIPAIVGAKGVLNQAAENHPVWMNGDTGEIVFQPEPDLILQYKKYLQKSSMRSSLLKEVEKNPALTSDGHQVLICLNAGQKEEIPSLNMEIYDGVGLFRTEFLYMGETDYPSEEAQFLVYKELAEQGNGKEIVIRTLDIGGDKKIDYMQMPDEDNPFLGYRAIRICLDRPSVFRTQLRAILRASAYGNLSIMFPMIVNLEELRQAKQLLAECMKELEKEHIPYDPSIKTGIMIETPAAVLISDLLAKEVDFFSIGTNDLIQYVTASDRMNEKIQYLYRDCNLSVLRAVKTVTENAHKAGITVSICGEAASNELLTPLWVGLGIDKLSMVPSQSAVIKYIVRHLSKDTAEEITNRVFHMTTISEIETCLQKAAVVYKDILA
ncbi:MULTISPECIES: phosphoenolpyruvate--protein phosphotransferase [Mediterraneibacter]|uniref:phosphoenolpyruvate--protein phosphotransferase n=1 Tax=Mediterraneibacter TaxID=2316020 RepID=UPI0022E8E462|nr:phosphoenolpyruvate--protein phosphotransferase [Mediterraneibacter massiliensis]